VADRPSYLDVLKQRVLVYDGAMGTSIQRYDLDAADFGGEHLVGCNDFLVITRPDVIEEIHVSFLDVGCDVLETDTFRSNRLTLKEYRLDDQVLEINRAAAQLARRVADRYATPERPRYVAGSIGPSGFLPSASDPSLGNITYEELVEVFREQAEGLIDGGVDVLLIETSQDLLEVKAAITGCRAAIEGFGHGALGVGNGDGSSASLEKGAEKGPKPKAQSPKSCHPCLSFGPGQTFWRSAGVVGSPKDELSPSEPTA
jgi:5-methyltetrahydrofolate--homocysteine methyltransferase